MILCPVCCGEAPRYADGTIGRHKDGIDKDCWMTGHVAPSWNEERTRQAVHGRSGGICEFCGIARAQEMHHRKSRGVGGQWSPANILHLCNTCHRRATLYPTWAKTLGLRVLRADNPELVPVTRDSGTVFQPSDRVTTRGDRG
jgi:5-methylcytosine-specific restriction endonuclease McrA